MLRTPLAVLIGAIVLAGAAIAALPALTGRVVDQANILSEADEATLSSLSEAHEKKTGDQIVVVTVASLGDEAIEDYGVALGRAWKIGEAGKNNGVLLIVAPNDRQVRIEVGYGLEGELPDAIAKLIIESSILPRFRAGDMAGGVRRGIEDIIAVLEGDAAAYKEQAQKRIQDDGGIGVIPFLFILAIFLFVFFLGGRGGGGSYRGGYSGGGFSGRSSGGGFSGGGGSFGGGGASGGW